MAFEFSLIGAQQAAERGRLQEWVVAYLKHPQWQNETLSRVVEKQLPIWLGPIDLALDKLVRICGPEEGMRFPEDDAVWKGRLEEIKDCGLEVDQLAPIIVRENSWGLNVADGNHRLGLFQSLGRTTIPCLLWRDSDPMWRDVFGACLLEGWQPES